jgi:hypothetical protein
MKLVQPATLVGGIKLLNCVTLENIAEAIVRDDLASEEDVRKAIEELYAFARDPNTVAGGPRCFRRGGGTEISRHKRPSFVRLH